MGNPEVTVEISFTNRTTLVACESIVNSQQIAYRATALLGLRRQAKHNSIAVCSLESGGTVKSAAAVQIGAA